MLRVSETQPLRRGAFHVADACQCERPLRSNLARMKGIASGLRPLAMTAPGMKRTPCGVKSTLAWLASSATLASTATYAGRCMQVSMQPVRADPPRLLRLRPRRPAGLQSLRASQIRLVTGSKV
jgi:hypothetical protein